MAKKIKMTTDAINQLFGIQESFELPEILLKKLLNKKSKDELCRDIMQFDFDINNDCLRDYFQTNNANRSNLKQDYTPDCLCQLIGKLIPDTEKVIDICAGTGALTIGINQNIQYQCEELSSMSIPVLLLNLALRGLNATVLQKNVLLNKVEKVYKLSKSGRYSDIEIVESWSETKVNVVISNPPYSLKWKPMSDARFDGYELPPANASDYAFVLDGLSRLSENGRAFYILPAGVLYRGNAESKIRKQLVENNLIDAVISLPENLFLNTSIPVNILVFNKAKKNKDILFISADKLFNKSGKQNIMTEEHIKKIAGAYWNRKTIDKFSKVVYLSEIKENDYCLSVKRYVDIFEREELPPLSEITKDIMNCNIKLNKATNELIEMLRDICGDEEYNELKQQFVDYFDQQDIVGKTMIEYLELQNLEKK